jgi:hypothetical protein
MALDFLSNCCGVDIFGVFEFNVAQVFRPEAVGFVMKGLASKEASYIGINGKGQRPVASSKFARLKVDAKKHAFQ